MQQVQLPKQSTVALRAQHAPTAQQAKRAVEASHAIHLDELKQLHKQAPKQVETFLSNYNDPTELNSYIDALTNREAVSKKFGDAWGTMSTASGTVAVLSFAGALIAAAIPGGQPVAAALAKVGAIASIPAIPAAADVTIEKGIKPILAGKPKEAFLNTLMNLGETMDFSSNPIKGLFIEGPEGFVKGFGLAEGGRVNYDFGTGSVITDMLLEVISDPINWVQFGAKTVLKTGTKTVGETFAKQLMGSVTEAINVTLAKTVGELTTEASERVTKKVTKVATKISQEWSEASYKKLTDAAKQRLIRDGKDRIQRVLVNALKKELPEASNSAISRIISCSNKAISKTKTLASAMSKIENITMDTLSSDIIKHTAGVLHYSDAFEKFMTKGALMSSGLGLGVEAAKYGWKGINAWQNNFTTNRLQKAGLYNKNTGINLAKWKDAKAIWEASADYTTNVAGVITQRDKNAFYKLANEQLNRDLDLVKNIVYGKGSPIEKAAVLDAKFTELYGYDFATYVGYLKGISSSENDMFNTFVKYNTNAYNVLKLQGEVYATGFKPKTGVQLLNVTSADSFGEFLGAITEKFSGTLKLDKDRLKTTDKFYTVKINDARFNAFLLNDPVIKSVYEDDGLYNLVKNIAQDSNAPIEVHSAAERVMQSFDNFRNLKEFYDAVGQVVAVGEDIKNADAFKAGIIDIITGMRNTVSDALAGFDDITMTDVMHKLELMFDGFNAAGHPEIKEQIAEIYKAYLEAQQRSGLEVTDAAILQNFTENATDLQKLLPDFQNELSILDAANTEIKTLMNLRETFDESLSGALLSDRKTIFDIFKVNSEQELSELGLAFKALKTKEALNYFDLPTEISGNVLASVQQLGKAIQRNVNQLQQYSVDFSEEMVATIDIIYTKFRQTILLNPKWQPEFEIQAFALLKETTDPYERVSQLIEFNKMHKDKDLAKLFDAVLADDTSSRKVWDTVKHPEQYFVTDFAWDAQKQSAWIAEKQLNEDIINPMQMYDNLSLQARKIEHDFQEFRKTLSDGKLDRPQALQQERYINALRKINNMLQYLEQTYASRFNRDIAKERIEQLRGIFLQFPELDERYSELVDTLEDYWNGIKHFEQSPKSTKGTQDFVDEFTPFWENIKKMNSDIKATVRQHNNDVKRGVVDSNKMLNFIDISPWEPFEDQQKLNYAINKATDINAKAGVYEFCSLTPEELKQELACRYRFVTFKDEDLEGGQLRYIFEQLKANNKDVNFYYDEKTHRHWIYLNKNEIVEADGRQVYLNSNPVARKQFKKRFDEFEIVDKVIDDPDNPGITKTLNELDNALYELTGTHLGTSQGEYMSDRTLREIHKQMPKEVQDAIDIDNITNSQFFQAYRFNESVLGSRTSKAELGMYSGNMITNARNAMVQAGSYTKAKTEYANAVFNSVASIDNPNGVFANYTNEEICEALQANPEYKLVTLADDAKHGVKVHEILPTSPKAIVKAKELGAVIIPTQTFKDMYNIFNVRIGSTGAAKWWSRFMYIYKFGYLCRPGAWIRNFIDTNLKSGLEMGDEYASYKAQAHKILDDVHRMQDFIQSQEQNGLIKSDAIREWFEKGYNKYISYDEFIELDRDFLSLGISGNITNMLGTEEAQGAWRTFTNMTGKIINVANKTEDYNRLAMYLYELDQGLDYTSALSKLAKTHFDYSFKTKAEQLVEMVFPFTTFSLKNYSYWIEQIEKHPWIMHNYIHLMKPHWDFKDYTPQELARDKRVQTQILYGQLKLAEFNNKVIAFKANPSIQDAIQMFSDPINNVYEKLAAPLKVATGQETPSVGMTPMIGPAIQAVQTTLKTGSPLPSVIGMQPVPKRTGRVNFTNPNLSGTDKYTDNTYRTPKYRNNINFDSYKTKGVTRYRKNFYPVIDIAHDLKMKYTTNVYAKIKNKVQIDVYKGIRYRIKLDAHRFT